MDTHIRLETHKVALRLVVAESLKDYHEQFKMILTQPTMPLASIGPELLELNRESLKLQLDLANIKPQTEEEQKAIESRISERFAAKFSGMSSPEAKASPKAPKTVNFRNASNEKRLDSEDGGKSTAISTQRPPERIRSNALLSPNALPSASRTGQSTAQRQMSGTTSGDRQAPAAGVSVEDLLSQKERIISQQKKNNTITEEDHESDSMNNSAK